MSKRATIRKITVDGDTYAWCVTKNDDNFVSLSGDTRYEKYRHRVAVWPITYKGQRQVATMGPAAEVGYPATVTPKHVADFIKANKEKF